MRLVTGLLCGLGVLSGVACSSAPTDGGTSGGGDDTLKGRGDGEVRGAGYGSGTGGTAATAGGLPSASAGASSGSSAPGSGMSEGPAPSGDASSDPSSGESSGGAGGESSPEPIPPTTKPGQPQAGILTAGAWDDNRNFERFLGYRSTWAELQLPGLLPISEDELKTAHEVWKKPLVAHRKLDISLVIDTTGSMGDEIAYLQSEFLALSNAIAEQYPGSDQRWSLVAYKDVQDEYIARWFDFRTDAEDFRQHLGNLSAGGGGDFPESPERAFEAAEQLAWRTDETAARLAFWVADAPHHDDRAAAMAEALRGMQGLGVHVYPVASSGVDDLTELSMRTAAALTGGRYLFLTNDSGVGGDHKEPTVPCYFVTSLRDAIVRMVDIELGGEYHEPLTSQVLRTGGDPHDGACKLGSGESVLVY